MKQIQLRLRPDEAFNEAALLESIMRSTNTRQLTSSDFKIVKRSIDARKKQTIVQLEVLMLEGENPPELDWSLSQLTTRQSIKRKCLLSVPGQQVCLLL